MKLRTTRALAFILTSLILLCVYRSSNLPGLSPVDSNAQLGRIAESDDVDSIRSLWNNWSKIIHDNAPQTRQIVMSCNALLTSLPGPDYEPRVQATNCVANPESDIKSLQSSHKAFLEALQDADVTADVFDGTGIVMMGGGEYFGPAIIGLHMLRQLGCTLPVEIFVADQSEWEPAVCEDYLPLYNARCVVLSSFFGKVSAFDITHFQLKSLAMLFSSFEEILYLDSDSIPLIDPATELFSTEPYLSSGLVIWPDFWIATESPLFYNIAGIPFPPDLPKTSSESGQVLMNKKTHLKSLLLAIYYNVYGPDIYYPLFSQGVMGQGDKETFMAAALVTSKPYYRVKTDVESAGYYRDDGFKGGAMIQHHPGDDLLLTKFHAMHKGNSSRGEPPKIRPAFIHANTPKMNAGHLVDEGDLFDGNNGRVRLWGAKELQESIFGYDLEKAIWELLRKTGCELAQVIAEWKHRKMLCERLEAHWSGVF